MATAGNKSISLSWDVVGGADSYKVYQSTQIDDGYSDIATNVTQTTYTATSLNAGQRYYFKIKSTTGSNDSGFSEAATAITNVDDQGNVFDGNWLLVSNESTDSATGQSTGTLSTEMGMKGMMGTPELELEAYRINPILPFEPTRGERPVEPSYDFDPEPNQLNDTRLFNVYNYQTGAHGGQITGRLAYIGTGVEVWVECSGTPTVVISDAQAEQIGQEFDDNIYSLITSNFYNESDVNEDGKIAILCFDIQDGYSGSGGYVGGYFWGGDLFDQPNSNKMEIFYIDTYPGMGKLNPDVTKAYSTLAHEFQHMVNFNRNYIDTSNGEMDTWLNEALSMAAEHLYEGVQTNRISYYNSSTAVQDGRSLLDWNSNNEVLANYSLSYLFSQYLRTQLEEALGSGHSVKYFNEIIEDSARGYEAVANVIHNHIDGGLSFGEFMTNFRAAMLLKASTGPFGFAGETGFDSLSTLEYTGNQTDLAGGGAVVKSISSSFTDPEDQGTDIKYLGIFQP